MKTQDIIDKFRGELLKYAVNISSTKYDIFSNATEMTLKELQSSLTSLLDDIEKDLRPARSALYANAQYPSTRETELSIEFQRGVNEGESRYRQEVINIINSHR